MTSFCRKTYAKERAEGNGVKLALEMARNVTRVDYVPRYADPEGTDVAVPGGRYVARINVPYDDHARTPWDDCTPLGEVEPVGRYYCGDHPPSGKRFIGGRSRHDSRYIYDFAGAVAEVLSWEGKHMKRGKAAALDYARKMATQEMERFDDWLRDGWHWIGVEVELFAADKNGRATGPELAADSLWGIEDDTDYWRVVADELIGECVHQAESARLDTLAACHPHPVYTQAEA